MKNFIKNRLKDWILFPFGKERIFNIITDQVEMELLKFRREGYLAQIGWFESYTKQIPLDSNNQPIPWVTYPFIDFIKDRLTKDLVIFEYGSGNSTLFYSSLVHTVVSVEHNLEWFEKLKSVVPVNVELIFEEMSYGGRYCRSSVSTNKKYDVIIVDGRDRVNSVIQSVEALNEAGVIVLDDSEREEYKNAFSSLLEEGFNEIGFWGISPGSFYKKCTTIFYKRNNCLNI